MKMLKIVISFAIFLSFMAAAADEPEWTLVKEDDFNRVGLGTDWLVMRGEWHINEDKQLEIQRQWQSHSVIAHNQNLRGKNVKVEIDVQVPSRMLGYGFLHHGRKRVMDSTGFGINLQSGILDWAGGGIDNRAGIELNARIDQENAGETTIPLDHWACVVLTLVDGKFTASIDGRVVREARIPQGQSLVNNGLSLYAVPCALFDNLRIYTAPMAEPLPALNTATNEENRRATVILGENDMDPDKPDWGIQEAIDSLPAGGGVVVLPRGHFVMRTYLELGSHTVLAGQGPETILEAMPITQAWDIENIETDEDGTRLTVKEEHDFRPGDAFSYCRWTGWTHPAGTKSPGIRLRVIAVDGNVLTVTAPPVEGVRQPYQIFHFFPLVCSYESEWAEVRDMTLRGPAENAIGAQGRFMTNPVTFGVASHPRFTRLMIENWPADGISAQRTDGARMFDNTFRGTQQAMHPGTNTLQTMVARNVATENNSGLYFCWYNSQGIYYRNIVNTFTGYPDSGDVFNTLSFNTLTGSMMITVGYNGSLFRNRIPELHVSHPPAQNFYGNNTYGNPARYFTIGDNEIDLMKRMQPAWGNVLAANRTAEGEPTPVEHLEWVDGNQAPLVGEPEHVILANDADIEPITGLPDRLTRAEPVPSPSLPEPILAGQDFYRPGTADCGFQEALDRLAANGGTLQLPAGRYALEQPLRVPSGVTLSGYGSATVLLPERNNVSLLDIEEAERVVVRDLVIEGDWRYADDGIAAIRAKNADGLSLIALDIRGWAGDAVSVANSRNIVINDSRVFRAAGAGYLLENTDQALIETSSATMCANGFVIEGGRGARLFGNISGINGDTGYKIRSSGAVVAGNNAHNNLHAGILVVDSEDVTVAGNTCANNNQGTIDTAGIHLAGTTTGARVLYNNCGDDQQIATQMLGILEDDTARKSEIRFNVTATLVKRAGTDPSLIAKGGNSVVNGNWTDTLTPVGDALEAINYFKEQNLTMD